jgi:hypothetical protein
VDLEVGFSPKHSLNQCIGGSGSGAVSKLGQETVGVDARVKQVKGMEVVNKGVASSYFKEQFDAWSAACGTEAIARLWSSNEGFRLPPLISGPLRTNPATRRGLHHVVARHHGNARGLSRANTAVGSDASNRLSLAP